MLRNAMLIVSWACDTLSIAAFVAAYFIPDWRIDLILFGLVLLGLAYMFSDDLVLKQENEALTKRVEILEEEVSTLTQRVDQAEQWVLILIEHLPHETRERQTSKKGQGA